MDFFGVVAVIAVLAGAGWVISKLRDALWRGVNQNVLQRRSHTSGQELVTSPLEFTSTLPASEILRAVTDAVALPVGPQSRVLGDLYIDEVTRDSIAFASGSRLGVSFRSRLVLTEDDGTTSGHYQVTNWTESDGIVSDITQMNYLRRKIGNALHEV